MVKVSNQSVIQLDGTFLPMIFTLTGTDITQDLISSHTPRRKRDPACLGRF